MTSLLRTPLMLLFVVLMPVAAQARHLPELREDLRIDGSWTLDVADTLMVARGVRFLAESDPCSLYVRGCLIANDDALSDSDLVVIAGPEAAPLDVSWFGAVGDGITDDTDALERATASGAPLTLKGTFRLSRTLTGKSRTLIGDHASLVASNAINAPLLAMREMSGIHIEGISFAYDTLSHVKQPGVAHPVEFNYCSDMVLKNLTLRNGKSLYIYGSKRVLLDGITIESSSYMGLLLIKCSRVRVENCHVSNAVSAYRTHHCEQVLFRFNEADSCYSYAFRIENSSNVMVDRNRVTDSAQGIVLYSPSKSERSKHMLVSNNLFVNCFRAPLPFVDEDYFARGPVYGVMNVKMGVDSSLFLRNTCLSDTVLQQRIPFSADQIEFSVRSGEVEFDPGTASPVGSLASLPELGVIRMTDLPADTGWVLRIHVPDGLPEPPSPFFVFNASLTGLGVILPVSSDDFSLRLFGDQAGTDLLLDAGFHFSDVREYEVPVAVPIPPAVPGHRPFDWDEVRMIEIAKKRPSAARELTFSGFRLGLNQEVGFMYNYVGKRSRTVMVLGNTFSNTLTPVYDPRRLVLDSKLVVFP